MEVRHPTNEIFHPTLCTKQTRPTNNPCKNSCSSKCQCITKHPYQITQIKFSILFKIVVHELTQLFHNSISSLRRKYICRMARLSDNKIHHKLRMLTF